MAIKNPATIAVYKPCAGVTPEAMANAIDKGIEITATVKPPDTSRLKQFKLYPCFLITSHNFGA